MCLLKKIEGDYPDYESIEDSGFSLNSLNDDASGDGSYFTHKFIKYDEDENWPTRQTIQYQVNMIIVDPNLKYHVMPLLSYSVTQSIGDIRNYILTKQINFNEVSGSNTMQTVNVIAGHIEKHFSNSEQINPGMSWDDLTFRIIFALIVIWIILHIRYRRKHPKRIWIEDPDEPRRDDNYDSGYLDGHYIGLHEDDDRDDH